jgi:SNF2 family DNA or RNA helicase
VSTPVLCKVTVADTQDLIETTLSREGVRWLRFDGSLSQAQRAACVEEFGEKAKEPVVLLISLKAGGVGLNLTMANRELLLPQAWLTHPRCLHDGYVVERGD